MAGQEQLLTDAYIVGVELRAALESGQSFCTALRMLEAPFDVLDDGYPEWHPAPYPFEAMVRLFLYRELTGESYRSLTKYPELADVFGLEKIPDESVLSRTWRNRFDGDARKFVTTAAHYVVKEIHDRDIDVPEARPKTEVVTSDQDPSAFPDGSNEDGTAEVTTEQIQRIMASMGSSLVELRTPATRTHYSSNYNRSWGWSAVARPRAPTDFSIDTDQIVDHTATRISEQSNSSTPRL